jgi:hypothetical protein
VSDTARRRRRRRRCRTRYSWATSAPGRVPVLVSVNETFAPAVLSMPYSNCV